MICRSVHVCYFNLACLPSDALVDLDHRGGVGLAKTHAARETHQVQHLRRDHAGDAVLGGEVDGEAESL